MESIKKNYNYLLFSFILISVLSWLLEIAYSLIFRHVLVNPGTLYGPYCQIYGLAFILIILVCNKKDNIFLKVIKIGVISTVVEYVISFICEKLYHIRVWDYSDKFLNINGRVCLEMSVLFTILGIAVIYLIGPLTKKIYDKLGSWVKYLNIFLAVIMVSDLTVTLITKAYI